MLIDWVAAGIGDRRHWALRAADQAVVFATPDFSDLTGFVEDTSVRRREGPL